MAGEYKIKPPTYEDLKRQNRALLQKTKGFGIAQNNTVETLVRIINEYLQYHNPTTSNRWLDWKGQANCLPGAAGVPVVTVVMQIVTSARPCVLHRNGVGFAAGSAIQLNWDWFISVNRQDYPASENIAGVYSIVSASLSDVDLQETFILVPPRATVQVRCENQGIAIDLHARVSGWYI